jgi:amidohydrolase
MNFLEQATAIEEKIIGIRRDIHQNPELGFQEFDTTDRIVKELEALRIPYRRLSPTGVVADIVGELSGKTVALRADIDALPVTEETGLPFQSKKEGIMHACGHDTHVAMLIGAAQLLQENRNLLKGSVRLIFQPAEEIGQGAKVVVDQGGLDGVDIIFGIHIGGHELGVAATRKGAMFAASDKFKIKITGEKCHGAFPHTGIDATLAGAAVVTALHSGVHREFDALEPLVVSVGSFHSDGSHNVVAGEAVMEGTVRCYDSQTHLKVQQAVKRLVKNTAEAYRCKADINYQVGTEVLINDDRLVELTACCAEKLTGKPMQIAERLMGSEDFSEYTARVPGVFISMGSNGQNASHSGKFMIDEAGLKYGCAMYVQLAVDGLQYLTQ